jgi:hypothetical protein
LRNDVIPAKITSYPFLIEKWCYCSQNNQLYNSIEKKNMNIFCVLQLDFTIVNNYHIAGYFGWKNISQFLVKKNMKTIRVFTILQSWTNIFSFHYNFNDRYINVIFKKKKKIMNMSNLLIDRSAYMCHNILYSGLFSKYVKRLTYFANH